jgi:hypothetical protein
MENVQMTAKATGLKATYLRDYRGKVISTRHRVFMETEAGDTFTAAIDDPAPLYKIGVNIMARFTIDETNKEFAHLGGLPIIESVCAL